MVRGLISALGAMAAKDEKRTDEVLWQGWLDQLLRRSRRVHKTRWMVTLPPDRDKAHTAHGNGGTEH
jgi:hypothetical protein